MDHATHGSVAYPEVDCVSWTVSELKGSDPRYAVSQIISTIRFFEDEKNDTQKIACVALSRFPRKDTTVQILEEKLRQVKCRRLFIQSTPLKVNL